MKKKLIPVILALLISLLVVGSASAKKNKLNVKGEVTAISPASLTVNTNKGEFTISIPADVDVSGIEVGDEVLVKAVGSNDGSWVAESVKVVGQGGDDTEKEEKNEDKAEGEKDNSAFCAEDKQEKNHPLAAKLSEHYDVEEEWVMEKICDGYSVGAIMLALKTSQLDGVDTTPEELLAGRADGVGWGQIWKELKLIGAEKNGNSPPGQLKKPKKVK
jgi:hypothetical protein